MQSFLCRSVISSTSRRSVLARRTTQPVAAIYRQPSCSSRYASTSASSSSSTSESAQVPASAQPTTSPDKQHDPLSNPAMSEGSNAGSKDAATVSQKQQEEEAQAMDDGHILMSEQEKEILAKLQKEFPGGAVAVQDVSGGCGTFFAISIESDKFKGLSKIKQHQKVNKILEDEVKTWHGMQLKTMAI